MSEQNDENLEPRRIVWIRDEDTDESLDMEVFLELEQDGRTYALITPPVPTVNLFQVDDAEAAEEGEALNEADLDTFKALRPQIDEFLKPWGVTVSVKGSEIRLSDELPEQVYADSPLLEIEADEEPETFLQLGELDSGDTLYWLLMPSPPPLYAVSLQGDQATYLSDEELERLQPLFDEAMAEIDEEIEDGGTEKN